MGGRVPAGTAGISVISTSTRHAMPVVPRHVARPIAQGQVAGHVNGDCFPIRPPVAVSRSDTSATNEAVMAPAFGRAARATMALPAASGAPNKGGSRDTAWVVTAALIS